MLVGDLYKTTKRDHLPSECSNSNASSCYNIKYAYIIYMSIIIIDCLSYKGSSNSDILICLL